ncbi:DoxX family protein [Mucilaginibacter terrenus]|uniref:DoxX family protein n=1 Tax=Mucilaginibacter terrenus TaxID=2482727 RepID=A0A3E2NKU6_9SPHI|nr:BT_3928 family protein [Mucilaginibacter terrenus]RFZ81624.1 DoxX family protein [Mucilaginibacter terrenus]
MKNRLVWFCRIAVGLLFIFSGLIKANDPLGFSYKLEEYFEVFGLTFLSSFSLAMAIILCALEMLLGFSLLVGVRAVRVVWGLLLLIVFFGFLTFYSAYFKVVQTCGCFGDAIPLTPWQSFIKDMVLLALVLVLFVNRKRIQPLVKQKVGDKLLIGAAIVSVGFGLYTYNFMPIVDFLPYKVGNNILAQMKTPRGAAPDEFEITYHLKNKETGDTKTMTDKEYLKTAIWKDTNWEIIGNPENKLIKKGFEPKIRDLNIQDNGGTNYNQELLSSPYYSLWIVADNLEQADNAALAKLNALAANLIEHYNTRVILLTSNAPQNAEQFAKQHKLVTEVFYADGVPLKTMVRANPGIMLIKNGTVVNKWHYHNVPSYDDLVKQYFSKQ